MILILNKDLSRLSLTFGSPGSGKSASDGVFLSSIGNGKSAVMLDGPSILVMNDEIFVDWHLDPPWFHPLRRANCVAVFVHGVAP